MTLRELLIFDYFAVMGMYLGGECLKGYFKKKRKEKCGEREEEK